MLLEVEIAFATAKGTGSDFYEMTKSEAIHLLLLHQRLHE